LFSLAVAYWPKTPDTPGFGGVATMYSSLRPAAPK
jgi:hypothetical protein